MKYAVFFLALFAMPPIGVALSFNRRWVKYTVFAMIAALGLYQSTAINFFSFEDYRGSSRGMEVSFVHLLSFAILVAAAFKRRLPSLIPSFGALLYVVYFLLCLPSYATAESMLFSWMETWKMIMIYMVYLSIRAYLDMTENVKALVGGFAFFVVWNFILIAKDHFAGVYQPDGAFPHQNCLAMAMHLFAGMYFALFLLGGLRKSILNVVALATSAACIVRTYSRGAIALVPISFFVTFVLSFVGAAKGAWMKIIMRIIPIGLAGLLGVGVMLPRIIERFEKAPEASANTRVELALCAREMIIDEPWWGVGMNNWGIKIKAPYEYAARARRDIDFANEQEDGIVETVYLLVCAECGIPALVAMLAWFLRYLVLCVSLSKKLSGTYYAAIPAGLAGGLVACYLQSCLEWVLRQQMNLIILMVFFALLDYLAANVARLKGESAEKGAASA